MHTTLVIDVHSDSVGAALAGVKPKTLPVLIYFARRKLPVRKDLSYKSLEKAMLLSLREVLSDLLKEGVKRLAEKGYPRDIHHGLVTLSTPWTESKLISKWFKDDNPFAFDEHMAKHVLAEEKKNLEENSKRPVEVFSSAVTSLTINGYESEFPSSVPVQEAQAGLILSYADKYLISQIETEVMKVFSLRKGFLFQSFPYVFSQMVKEILKHNRAMLVDFSSDSTDVVVVRNGKISDMHSFVFGSGVFTRAISNEFDYPPELGRSMLNMFSQGALDKKTASKLDGIVGACESLWHDHWKKIPEENISSNIFIYSGANDFPLIRTLLERVVPDARITHISDGNENVLGIGRHLVKSHAPNSDESIAMIAAYSASLL